MLLRDFRANGLEPAAGFVDHHVPVDAVLPSIESAGPGRDFGPHGLQIANPTMLQALPRHAAEFALGDVQLAAVLRRLAELDALRQ